MTVTNCGGGGGFILVPPNSNTVDVGTNSCGKCLCHHAWASALTLMTFHNKVRPVDASGWLLRATVRPRLHVGVPWPPAAAASGKESQQSPCVPPLKHVTALHCGTCKQRDKMKIKRANYDIWQPSPPPAVLALTWCLRKKGGDLRIARCS